MDELKSIFFLLYILKKEYLFYLPLTNYFLDINPHKDKPCQNNTIILTCLWIIMLVINKGYYYSTLLYIWAR